MIKIDFCGDLTKAYFPETFRNQRMRAKAIMGNITGSMIISLLMNINLGHLGRSFDIADVYNYTTTLLSKHDHMARYFPIFLVFGAKFQYFDNGE